jgi:transcription elongation factor Elf1
MVIFFLATCALGYACYNLVKKIEVYEDWLDMFRNEIDQVYTRIKAVDDRNLFEKDDDVGFIFTEIVRITKEFDEKIK